MNTIKQLTNLELWEIISKEYIGVKDICKIGIMGTNTAQKLRKKIENELTDWLLPRNMVPTIFVLKKLNIDKNEIFINAKMEKELGK